MGLEISFFIKLPTNYNGIMKMPLSLFFMIWLRCFVGFINGYKVLKIGFYFIIIFFWCEMYVDLQLFCDNI